MHYPNMYVYTHTRTERYHRLSKIRMPSVHAYNPSVGVLTWKGELWSQPARSNWWVPLQWDTVPKMEGKWDLRSKTPKLINVIYVACLSHKRKLHFTDNSDPSKRQSQLNIFWKGPATSGTAKTPVVNGKRSRQQHLQKFGLQWASRAFWLWPFNGRGAVS